MILSTDDYTIYDDIDEYDDIDAHLAITDHKAFKLIGLFFVMNWPHRLLAIGIILLVVGIGLPYLVPADDDYEYTIHRVDTPISSEYAAGPTVPYQNLSKEEKSVFDSLISGDGSIRRENQANGSYFNHKEINNLYVPVAYHDRIYAVHAWTIRDNFTLRYWGRPILLLLGGVSLFCSVVVYSILYEK